MAKKNLAALGRQACDCQSDKEGWEKEGLVEVKERYYYEQKHKREKDDDRSLFSSSGPSIPETDDGTEIIRENFPDSNLVCPACGKEWLAVVDVYPLSEKGKHSTDEYKSTQSVNEDMDEDILDEIAESEQKSVSNYIDGEESAMNYLVGCVLQKTGGSVTPTQARDALDEYLENRSVEVTIPYKDQYTTSEKISEIDNIPDTDEAYDMFEYCPHIEVTFEWNKNEGTLAPQAITVDSREYNIE